MAFFRSQRFGALQILLLTISLTFSLVQATLSTPKLEYIPAKPSKGEATSRYVASHSVDGPFLSALNSSAFEWWWFEAVAKDLKSSLTMIFFTTSGDAFPLSGNTDSQATSVFVTGLLPNGTVFYDILPASGAILASSGPFGKAASANFVDSGATFVGSPDLRKYKINIRDLEKYGIRGSLELTSTAPAHYPCSKNLKPGQTLEIFPHIGWSNAIPSGRASGTMYVGDQKLTFDNDLGYHDHNWGDQPFTSLIKSWYWGHATLGPYSVVWFNGIIPGGKEQGSAYIAKDGKILQGSCAPGSVRVRPKGGNATYPPTPGAGSKFKYLEVTMKLPGGKEFVAKVVPESLNINARPLYSRWIGRISGGIRGEKVYHGITAFEEFTVY